MSCQPKNQSAIYEVRDQLMLDLADGLRLDTVSSNLGIDRPTIGIDDDEWRALVKAVGLQRKLVPNVFRKVMEICAGPQKTRVLNLQDTAATDSDTVVAANGENILQLGTLVFDPGLDSEEEIPFCYRNLVTGEILLSESTTQVHTPVAAATGHLTTAAAIDDTTITVDSVVDFPATGFPYSAIIDQGAANEELIVITGISTLTLSLLNPLTLAHNAAKSTFIQKSLNADAAAGRDFVFLAADATRVFPNTGYIRLNFAEANEETVEYVSNDVATSTLKLRGVLQNDHVAAESLELVTPGAAVSTLNAIQRGVGWRIYETAPLKVQILIPAQTKLNRLVDASFLHAVTPTTWATTLAADAAIDDETIEVADASGFRETTGAIYIDGSSGYTAQYTDITGNVLTLSTPLTVDYATGTSVAAAKVNYTSAPSLEEGNLRQANGSVVTGVSFKPEFSGPYIYDHTQYGVSRIKTTLTEALPPVTTVAVKQAALATTIEVADAQMWPTPPFDPFRAKLGRGTGFSEITEVVDVTLKLPTATFVAVALGAAGESSIQGLDTTGFPQSSDGTHAARYRIIIGEGTANEEVLLVNQNSAAAPGTFTLLSKTTQPHATTELINLMADVITTDVLTQPHTAGQLVDKIATTLPVASTTAFPDEGVVWLNYGKNRINVRQKIVAIVSSTVVSVPDSSVFPQTDFPYRVVVREGLSAQHFAYVVANDVGTSRLTFSTPQTLLPDEYVTFTSGRPLSIPFTSKDATNLALGTDRILESLYTLGETVHYSPGLSVPSVYGFDYALKMPPSSVRCFTALVDLIRAAGVEVILRDDSTVQ